MMNLAEYRNRTACLADYLPWAALIAPGVVLNKDGSFQRTARFRGPDLDSATPAELVGTTGAAQQCAAPSRLRLGDLRRSCATSGAALSAQHVSGFRLGAGRPGAAGCLRAGGRPFRESAITSHSSGCRRRKTPRASKPGSMKAVRNRASILMNCCAASSIAPTASSSSSRASFPNPPGSMTPATLTYLHSTISTRQQRVRVPETPMHLDALLADQPLAGGLEPRLGDAHLRTLSVIGFPTTTYPGILDELNRLAFPYRWSTRAILIDKTDAVRLLTKIRRQWFAKRKSIAAILKEVMTNEASILVDTDAANKAADADMALQELGSDDVGQVYVTATVTVWDRDAGVAAEKLRLVEKIIQGRDFTCIAEGVNAIEAWLGSLPGQTYANVRQPPVSTLNLAHMIPLSAVWAGPERDEHFDAPPLLFGKTEGSTPFRFSLHVGDVGHTLVVGPTGAGKSVLLALIALQFRRYPRSQVFAFDFGGSIRAAALAMRGDWHDLGGNASRRSDDDEEPIATHSGAASDANMVSLQPLAGIHYTPERAWAADWIVDILAREGVAVTPEVKEHLWSALTSLASAPVDERTLTGLAVLLQSAKLKQALQPYCIGGPYGRLLDAENERLGEASVQAFETEGLIGTGAAGAVLAYLFHRIEGRLDGRPTLLIIDEGWLALDDGGFAAQLREWLKTLRKKNASVVFATQSLSDIDGSAIAPAIVESCPTRIFLPNERAIEPQITAIYQRFGLNDRQIEIIARATPKRDYYCQSRRGNRLFELGTGSDRARLLRGLVQGRSRR